jgi:hypothetical protein
MAERGLLTPGAIGLADTNAKAAALGNRRGLLSISDPSSIPPIAGGQDTHAWPLDPFPGCRSRLLARFGVIDRSGSP